jgi:flagellar hook protein FlgE
LVPVTINPVSLVANPSTAGTFDANLDANATSVTSNTPETAWSNTGGTTSPLATYTDKTSITAYDNQGNAVNLDVYFTKTSSNTWEVDVFNSADAASGGGFPYTSGPLTSGTLNFDPTTGALSSGSFTPNGGATTTGTTLPVDIPNGQTLNIDVSSMSQLASSFAVSNNTMNGNAPATFQKVTVSQDGTLSEVYSDGTTVPVYKIPLATVASVNSLTPVSGDAYQTNANSGSLVVGSANSGGFGSIQGNELESSTVDLATQLTNMVVSQNSYSANSKVFQVGSELLQELSNLIK